MVDRDAHRDILTDERRAPPLGGRESHGLNELERRIQVEQLRLIYGQGPVLVFGSLLCAVMVTSFLWRSLPQSALLFWMGALVISTMLRLWLIHAFNCADESVKREPHWGPAFWIGTLCAGIIWGAWPLIFYDLYDAQFLMLISTIFAGMVAVSAASGGIYPPAFLSFSMPLIIPLSIAHLRSGNDSLVMTGGLLLMFLVVNHVLMMRSNRQYRALIREQFKNADLMASLAREKRIAERAVIAKSRFLAAASHDLRQPLHALGMFITALRARERNPSQLGIIDDMGQSADALNGLFNSLLDMSRLDAEIIEFLPRHLSVHRLFDRMRAQFVQQASAKGIELEIAGEDRVIHTDAILFERVLRNLVSNAVQYTEQGTVRLSCEALDDGSVRVTLRDTGIGIPPAALEEVFSEYYQLNNPERDRSKGLGLGLAIVRRLCELMDMPLWMGSEPGEGTVFTLTVPGGDPLLVGDEVPIDVPGMADQTVLVIDDEPQVLQGMRHLLETHGCTVLIAESAREALQAIALADAEPSLILSDFRLRGDENGLDAIAVLREALDRCVPAAIITGDTSPQRLREINASGIDVLHKPVAAADLYVLIDRLLPPDDPSP